MGIPYFILFIMLFSINLSDPLRVAPLQPEKAPDFTPKALQELDKILQPSMIRFGDQSSAEKGESQNCLLNYA